MNREQLEEKALADYRSHCGVVILVSHLYGYNELDDSVDLLLDPPMRSALIEHRMTPYSTGSTNGSIRTGT